MLNKPHAWTEEEIDLLLERYSSTSWKRLTKILPTRTRYAIRMKASRLGLQKSRAGCGYFKFDENFFKNWSPEMAYIVGVIAADGEVYINKLYNKYDLEITSIDIDWLDEIRKVMKAEHPMYKRTYQGKNGKRSLVFRLRIGSKKLVNDLLKIGITPRKSLTLKFPTIPDQYLSHFVRGFFDGDGNIWAYMRKNRPCLQLSFCGTKDFLITLNKVIKSKVGCAAKNVNKIGNICRLRYNTREAEAVLRWMYHDMTLYLLRKYQEVLSFYEAREQGKSNNSSSFIVAK